MSRLPIYHEKNNEFRLVSFPNGLWQAQRTNGDNGRKFVPKVKGDKNSIDIPHYDPWKGISRPVDLASARRLMDERVAMQAIVSAS